jgi:predicted RNA binding protein YcfA (HicA-like mRNA interferase family)
MVDGFYKAIIKMISSNGFWLVTGGKGSHEKWINEDGKTLTVPRNLLSRFTANGILKDAGINKRL